MRRCLGERFDAASRQAEAAADGRRAARAGLAELLQLVRSRCLRGSCWPLRAVRARRRCRASAARRVRRDARASQGEVAAQGLRYHSRGSLGGTRRAAPQHRPRCPPLMPDSASSDRPASPIRASSSVRSSTPRCATRQALGASDAGRRGLRRRRPVGVGAQGRDWRTSSATATSRSASRSMSASGAATPARSDFSRRRSSRPCAPPTTSPASPPKTPQPACPTRPGPRRRGDEAARDLDLFHPWAIDAEAAAELALALRGGGPRHRSPASPTPKARACRRSNRTSAPATRAAFGGGYASSRHSLSVAPIACCRQGRRRHAARRLVQLDARRRRTRRARGRGPLRRRAGAVAAEVAQDQRPARCRCCSSRRWPRGCWAPLCRPRAAARCIARQLPARQPGQAGPAHAHRHPRRPAHAARQGQRAVRRRRRARPAGAQSRRRRRRRRLFPLELLGAQARHADHRQRRRLAQPDAAVRAARRRATTSTRCCASWAGACSSSS